jgi:hypothetical protein
MPNVARLEALLEAGPHPGPILDADHHLTRRGRMWLVRLIAVQRGRRVHITRSLKTTDVRVARKRRDEIIATVCGQPDAYVLAQARRRG